MIIFSFFKLTWIVYILEKLFLPVVSVCTWPTDLQDGVWIDSDKGSLTFNATHMLGWRLKTVVSSTVVTDWECQNKTGDFLVARASNNIDPLKSSFIAFLCLNMTQISKYSFYYYQHSAEQSNSNYERFAVTFSTMFTSFISNLSNMCTETPATSEFHMLLKDGFQNESKVYCPDAFLGMFSYTINNGSTTACGTHSEFWDVCTDRKVMTFSYNACTAFGSVYCVNSLTSGMYYYAAVYNSDTALAAYSFVCLMGSLSGNDVYVSQSANSCTKTQNPTSVPVTANGTSLGAFMYLKAYNTCRFESPSTSASTTRGSTSTNVGAIVGGTVGGLLFLIALVGSVILFYLCVLKKTPPKKLLEENYTKGEILERKQSTPYTEDKEENSLAQVKNKRSNDTRETEVISSKIFLKEDTGLEVKQQPPMETAYRHNPIFDRDRSNIVLVVTENAEKDQTPLDKPRPTHGLNSLTDGTKFAMNTVSGFVKYGLLPPLGFDSPGNKSSKHKWQRKKKLESNSTGVSAGSQVSSSIFETSVILSAQTDSSISNNRDLKMNGLIREAANAYPDLHEKDIIIRENKSAITSPATPTTSTGLGEVVSNGQGPVTVDIP